MKSRLTIILMLFFLSSYSFAGWVTNQAFGFKINVPYGWSTNDYIQGTDHVYDFMNANETIAIQLRAFKAKQGFSPELIINVLEQEILKQGAQKLSASDDAINGTPGKMAVYKNTYDGKEVGMVIFAAIANSNAYSFLIIIPTNVFDQKSVEADQVLETFTLLSHTSKPLSYGNSRSSRHKPRKKQLSGSTGSVQHIKPATSTVTATKPSSSLNHVAFDVSSSILPRPSGQADAGHRWFTQIRGLHFQYPIAYKPYHYGHWSALHSWSGSAGAMTLRYHREGKKEGFENINAALETVKQEKSMRYLGVRNIRGYMMHLLQSQVQGKRLDHLVFDNDGDIGWFTFTSNAQNYDQMDPVAKHLINSFHKGFYK